MDNKFILEDRMREELKAKANEVELSDKMLSKVIEEIESFKGGYINMLKNKVSSFVIKKRVAVSVCVVLAFSIILYTFSDGVRAATLNIVNSIKTIFVLDKSEGEYKIVEKSTEDALMSPVNGRNTELSDEELTEKVGFNVCFPKTLYGGYKYKDKAEIIGIKKQVSAETAKQLEADMFSAIEDITVFDSLGEYAPYRIVEGAYSSKDSQISIYMWASDGLEEIGGNSTEIKTKVGNADAAWIDEVYPNYTHITENGIGKADMHTKPDGIVMKHSLIWYSNGVRYYLGITKGSELSMEDAVKVAESFMTVQK